MDGKSKNKEKANSIQVKLAPRGPNEQSEKSVEDTKDMKGTLLYLSDKLERLSIDMEKAQLREFVDLMHRPWQLIVKNFIAGMARGVGIALGFTFFAATIVYLLQVLGALNLPIVGDYIADIVRIVQRQLEINPH